MSGERASLQHLSSRVVTAPHVTCNVALVLVLLATVAACGSKSQGGAGPDGGGGSGGTTVTPSSTTTDVASSSASISASGPCGTADGAACEPGAPCDPKLGCGGPPLGCQEFDTSDCSRLDKPFCLQGFIGTCGASIRACGCAGYVQGSDCLTYLGISKDPTFCTHGETFACGTEQCLTQLDVCVQSAVGAADGHCQAAEAMGCSQYGIADCACVDDVIEPSQTCTSDITGAVWVVELKGPGR